VDQECRHAAPFVLIAAQYAPSGALQKLPQADQKRPSLSSLLAVNAWG
jgi:hypothetical protein